MTRYVRGYGAKCASSDLTFLPVPIRALRECDVEINILYCGLCHTDVHMVKDDWRATRYPVVPGHEIVGRVVQIGRGVSKYDVGDLVGVGCMVDSCERCIPCTRGLQQYCEEGASWTYNGVDRQDGNPTYGGFSERIVVKEQFVLRIHPSLTPAAAAPLLCAGVTVFSPLKHWRVSDGSRVGVVGLGGLGHLAVKLSVALGAEVTVFTRSAEKESEARKLGASHVVVGGPSQQSSGLVEKLDVVIDTVPVSHSLDMYISRLSLDGVLVIVGLLENLQESLNVDLLVSGRRAVTGSAIGGIAETQELLDLCAARGIEANIELIGVNELQHAVEDLRSGSVDRRFVVDMSSMTQTELS